MHALAATDARYGFDRLIDLARIAPVAVAKHGRAVVVVMSVEEYERLKALDTPRTLPPGSRSKGSRRRMKGP